MKNFFGLTKDHQEWSQFISWVKEVYPRAPMGALNDLFHHWKELNE